MRFRPGRVLVNALIEDGLKYTVVSGASAFLNAFVLSGFAAPFTFVGFLPEKKVDRERLMQRVASLSAMIFTRRLTTSTKISVICTKGWETGELR